MNQNTEKTDRDLLAYQGRIFQGLLEEIVECCQARTFYLCRLFSLPRAELRCLMLLAGQRYLTAKDLARRLEVVKSRVTKIVDGLRRKGLVETVADPEDARVKLIRLTGLGRDKAAEIERFNQGLHQRLLADIPPAERQQVLGTLVSLRSAMEAIKKELA